MKKSSRAKSDSRPQSHFRHTKKTATVPLPFTVNSGAPTPEPELPTEQKHALDLVQYAADGACLRCGRVQKKEQRRVLVIFDAAGQEQGSGLSMCAPCAGIVRACLERGTRLVPIVLPDREVPEFGTIESGARR